VGLSLSPGMLWLLNELLNKRRGALRVCIYVYVYVCVWVGLHELADIFHSCTSHVVCSMTQRCAIICSEGETFSHHYDYLFELR